MSKQLQPIGVFDSGVGGISVLRELVKILPNEDYIYFGDSKNAPYGMKDRAQVQELTIEAARFLLDKGAKALVVACNTATSAGVKRLRELYPSLPLVGIEPALKPAAEHHPGGRILVMATPMTIREEKFRLLMDKYKTDATILPLPCPGLMDYVERGEIKSPEFTAYLEELLYEYRIHPVDGAVLGCTHYPFARHKIQSILGDHVTIYDGGEGTARELCRRLKEADLLNPRREQGAITFLNSLEDSKKIQLCKQLLQM